MSQPKLGPVPKRIPLYVTKGIEWSKIIVLPTELIGSVFSGSVKKTYKDATSYPFTFTAVSGTQIQWKLTAAVSDTMPVDCVPAEYVYTVYITPPSQPEAVFCQDTLTLSPSA